MTINEAIAQVDAIKPNAYPTAEKVRWLSELDGKIVAEILSWHEGGKQAHVPYEPDRLDEPLVVPKPYADVYVKYLAAQIDYFNNEIGRYNNAMVMFNIAYAAYADFANRTMRPMQVAHIKVSL